MNTKNRILLAAAPFALAGVVLAGCTATTATSSALCASRIGRPRKSAAHFSAVRRGKPGR
ncbi:MAG: hypothetical protein IJG47_15895 [Microbacterium sp.]|nr:hypothetical protein [Microbacterium sp.]